MSSSKLREYAKRIILLQNAQQLIEWNLATCAADSSVDVWSQTSSELSTTSDELLRSKKLTRMLRATPKDPIEKKITEAWRINRAEALRIPLKLQIDIDEASTLSNSKWKNAKTFEEVLPYLERVVGLTKEYTTHYPGDKPYDCLIDGYEPNVTQEYITGIFDVLKPQLISLRNEVIATNKFNKRPVMKASSEDNVLIAKNAATHLGFDFSRGVIATTHHPFMISFGTDDVRIAVDRSEDSLKVIYSALHEAGHGLYEQNVNHELNYTGIGCPSSCGLHESQSLFCETMLGKSELFWKEFYSQIANEVIGSGMHYNDMTSFVKTLRFFDPNNVTRLAGSELDYGLHIILRFEVEKALFSGEIETHQMKDMFNELTKQYFGRYPQNDRQDGVIQDCHWCCGLFGYFPSYLLGAVYASQLWYKLRSLPTIKDVTDWLKVNVHHHGDLYNYGEMLKMTTGNETPDTGCYINWLKEEYL